MCGGQQESGSACVASRGDDGQITFREWHPVGVEEYGYVAPDPLDPDIVYGGKVTRYDRAHRRRCRTSRRESLPRRGDYRVAAHAPVVFSPVDPHTLYFASNVVWKTTDGGKQLDGRSVPTSRATDSDVPPNVGIYRDSDAGACDARAASSTRSRRRRSTSSASGPAPTTG